MVELYRKALELADADRKPVLSTVISAQGSTPQKAGSVALLDMDGNLWGTLGGGMVEAVGLERMRQSRADGLPALHEFRLDEDYSRTAGPICGGVMRFFTNPGIHEQRRAVEAAIEASRCGTRGLLVTYVAGSRQGEVEWMEEASVAGRTSFPSGDELSQTLSSEVPSVISKGEEEAYAEPVVPTPRLLIVGGGHVGQAVAFQADILGFDVTVYDDREEFADARLFPTGTTAQSGNVKELVANYPKGLDAYIVLVSKGHLLDALALEACIHDDLRFLGMIGSRRKIRALKKHFLEDGLATQEEWDRIVSPIGYDIGAVSVAEIGVSIAAQLVAARRLPDAVRDIDSKSL
ncbi:MAG: XdhC family protein [Candidatus Hydrogenedentota bacterium]